MSYPNCIPRALYELWLLLVGNEIVRVAIGSGGQIYGRNDDCVTDVNRHVGLYQGSVPSYGISGQCFHYEHKRPRAGCGSKRRVDVDGSNAVVSGRKISGCIGVGVSAHHGIGGAVELQAEQEQQKPAYSYFEGWVLFHRIMNLLVDLECMSHPLPRDRRCLFPGYAE